MTYFFPNICISILVCFCVLSRPYLACVFSSVVFMGERFILIPESILMFPSVCVCVRVFVGFMYLGL